MSSEHQYLLSGSVQNHGLLSTNGRLTNPRTWGTYDLGAHGKDDRRFRYGNHPIRMAELLREHSRSSVVAVFYTRHEAQTLAKMLNATPPDTH